MRAFDALPCFLALDNPPSHKPRSALSFNFNSHARNNTRSLRASTPGEQNERAVRLAIKFARDFVGTTERIERFAANTHAAKSLLRDG